MQPGKLAIIVKTLLREQEFKNLVNSISKFCDVSYRLYIADEHPISQEKRELFDQLKSNGHHIEIFSDKHGVGWFRNHLFKQTHGEEYILRIDDDFLFTENTSIKKLIQVIESSSRIGIVSCAEIQGDHGKLSRINNRLPTLESGVLLRTGSALKIGILPDDGWVYSQNNSVRYALADYTRNFLLIKKALLLDSPWCNELVINGEHLDFFLSAKLKGWQIAFTPDVSYIHMGSPENTDRGSEYFQKRNTKNAEIVKSNVFLKKYGISSIQKFKINPHGTTTKRSLISRLQKVFKL